MLNNEFTIDLNFLSKEKLSLEAWFFLVCLFEDNQLLLENYIKNCRKIPIVIINDLLNRGLLEVNNNNIENATFKDFSLTIMCKEQYFSIPGGSLKNINDLFNEFRKIYPSIVKDKEGYPRRLHQDLNRCKKLYEKAITTNGKIDINKHESIINATIKMVDEKTKSNSLGYLQLMSSYLHQQNYNTYMVEISDNIGNDEFKQRI